MTSQWLGTAAAAGLSITTVLLKGIELGAQTDQVGASCTDISGVCNQARCETSPTSTGCLCLVNHLRWPDGRYNVNTNLDHEPVMLAFLRDHPIAGP